MLESRVSMFVSQCDMIQWPESYPQAPEHFNACITEKWREPGALFDVCDVRIERMVERV